MVNTIKIYKIPTVIGLTLTDHGVRNNSLPFNDNDFKIYRNSYNPIEFILRDNNRRPINLFGKSVVMTVWTFSRETVASSIENRRPHPQRGEVILQKTASCVEAAKGRIRITFTPNDIASWEPITYRYTMMIVNSDKTHNMLAIDQNQNASGFFQLIDRVLPEADETTIITDFTEVNETPPTLDPTNYITGAYPADAVFREDNGLHTVAIYCDDYCGKFYVEGSLEESPTSLDSDWFKIQLYAFSDYHEFGNYPHPDCTFTGVEGFNFTGSIRWVRFRHIPDIDNVGTIYKVLYRN